MSRASFAGCAIAALLIGQTAFAAPWRYDFAPGKTYGYRFTSDSRHTVKAMGMPGFDGRVEIETDYVLKVQRRLPDGRADVVIDVDRLAIHDHASGQRTTLADLPAGASRLRAYVTPRGRFQFYERVVVQVRDGAYALGVIKTSPTKASSEMTAQHGDEEVTVVAEIDMKTGRATGGIRKRKIAPSSRSQEEEAPAQNLDVLPVQVLALMELPKGAVSPGHKETLKGPSLDVVAEALAPAPCGGATCGRLKIRTLTRVDTGPAIDAATGPDRRATGSDEVEATEGMPGMRGIPEIPGMPGTTGMPGMEGLPGGAPPEMGLARGALDVTFTALLRFNPEAGNLHDLEGKVEQKSRMAGMTIEERATFKLAAVSSGARPTAALDTSGYPPAARKQIEAVYRAAQSNQVDALAPLMAKTFYFSFGDEPSAAKARAHFKNTPGALPTLAQLIASGCALDPSGATLHCPGNAMAEDYAGPRASFDRAEGWRLTSFIAGD